MPLIIPNLWFDTEALEAAEFYRRIFPNSEITCVSHYTEAGPGEPGTVLKVDFTLDGQPFTAINGGPLFPFTEAVSLLVDCADQAEVDRYWAALTDGGKEVHSEGGSRTATGCRGRSARATSARFSETRTQAGGTSNAGDARHG